MLIDHSLADIEALEGCTELKELNISRASFRMASASADHPTGIPLTILFHSLSKLPNLARLHLGQCKSDNPRAGSDGTESTDTRPIWPAKLEYLRLSAPIHDQHNQCPIMGECPVKTLRIELDMSPLSRRSTSLSFYGPLFGTNLLSLDFRGTTPKFTTEPLEFFRRYLKNLEHLTIEDSCFRTYLFTALEHIPDVHPLKELVILQGSTHCFCGQLPFDSTHPFDPETLHNFIRDGKLGNLRRVNVNDCIIQFNQINASYWIGRIDVLLTAKELERETGEGAAYIEHEVGIWVA